MPLLFQNLLVLLNRLHKKKPQPAPLRGSFHGIPPLHFSHSSNGRQGNLQEMKWNKEPKECPGCSSWYKRIQNSDNFYWNLQNGRPKLAKTLLMFGSGKICCVVQVVIWCYLLGTDFCSPHKHLETHENPLKPLMFDSLCRRSWDSKTMQSDGKSMIEKTKGNLKCWMVSRVNRGFDSHSHMLQQAIWSCFFQLEAPPQILKRSTRQHLDGPFIFMFCNFCGWHMSYVCYNK